MFHSDNHFSYLLSTKICHDLATPLGAISLGIDMANDPDMNTIMRSSLESATLKLNFYRMLLTPTEHAPEWGEVLMYLQKYSKHHDIHLTPNVNDDRIQGTSARLLLGLAHIGMEALLKGGRLEISAHNNLVKIQASSNRCLLRDSYQDMFCKKSETHTQNARTILPYFLIQLADSIKTDIICEYFENQTILFSFQLH